MQASDRDGYEAYYADKLWALLPEVYRAEDSARFDRKGPLRELVDRIGAQAAVVRRSMDRMWENQSIEACDDWAIAYLGDLLATNLVASLDARGQRIDVARTIRYRRRKGTLGVLEALAADVTGWRARVVEMFRRLGRTRHLLDPALQWPEDTNDPDGARALQIVQGLVGEHTRTPIGGFADLRNAAAGSRAGSAFDEFYFTADVRAGRGRTGLHGPLKLGVFLWRLHSFQIEGMTAVRGVSLSSTDKNCANQHTFDPSGRDAPLFAAAAPLDDDAPAREHDLPGPISARLLTAALTHLYAVPDPERPQELLPQSLDLHREKAGAYALVPVSEVTGDPREAKQKPVFIDPERGRVYLAVPDTDAQLRVRCHFGFSSKIGALGYDRRIDGQPVPRPGNVHTRTGGAGALHAALAALGPAGTGTIVLDDSTTYTQTTDRAVGRLTVQAGQNKRPTVRVDVPWTLTGADATSELALDGLFLTGGGHLVLEGSFAAVLIDACTLDPGTWDEATASFVKAIDGRSLSPFRLTIKGAVGRLEVRRSVVGPILVEGTGSVSELVITDSIVQATGAHQALGLPATGVELARVTVIGDAAAHHLSATDSILDGDFRVTHDQRGCVRFSAWRTGSKLPRRFEAVEVGAGERLFVSQAFGDPFYGALLGSNGAAVREGAEDGSEMGAFCREKNPVKERSLLIKYQEYMPIGLSPVLVYVT